MCWWCGALMYWEGIGVLVVWGIDVLGGHWCVGGVGH